VMTMNAADASPESRLPALLCDGAHGSMATAESCTGGGVTARLTSVSGSSAYVMGGIVAYSNEAKIALLGVDPAIIATQGAVSKPCALAMAAGARRAFGTTWAVSTSGIAGPTGATPTKPVGLVYIAVAGPDGAVSEEHVFPGDRAAVTAAATERALMLLVESVEGGAGQGRS
ncbi:MAG: CinA family protein, partial [Thermomicrobiales bacterium]